jgi:hypothetical protein
MTRTNCLIGAGLLARLLTFSFHSLAAAPGPGKWQSLFDGQDLKGWVPVHDVTFEVKDGNLRLVKGMGWLRSETRWFNRPAGKR